MGFLKMRFRYVLFAISFLTCNLAISQNTNKNQQKNICPQLLELIKDPSFISKIASENGLTSTRFYSIETPLQKEMIIRYGERHGICDLKNEIKKDSEFKK
jgi:hypothetical protein